MLQLHKILIGMVLVGVIMTGMMLFISGGQDYYSMTDYDNDTFSAFNQLNELQDDIETFDSDESSVKSDSSLLDILGNFFTTMYTSAKVFKGSVDVMGAMADDGIDQLPVTSAYSTMLKTALFLIFGIVISVGIFLAFVTKSERT